MVRTKVRLAEVVRELPRRAHDLSRRTVEESQRWRLLEAMTEVAAKRGYGDASIADVISVAGVSRKTFYEHFSDKEDCFLTAYDVVSERLIGSLVTIGKAHEDPDERRAAQVSAFLTAMMQDLAAARVFMIDVLGAGPRALERRERINRRFAEAVLGSDVEPVRGSAIIGGVNSVVASALLLEGPSVKLLGLAAPLTEFVRAATSTKRSSSSSGGPRRR